MKQSAIKLPEDIIMKVNRLKYQWGCKTQAEVIRKLIEMYVKKMEEVSE